MHSQQMVLSGLVAATHTPFDANGELNLEIIEKQAQHLNRVGVEIVFIGGTTGESHSLTVTERRDLTTRWCEVVAGSEMKVVVHVGSNNLTEAKVLAAQANEAKVHAISALAPSYFKPKTVEVLVEWCAAIALEAPGTPFYYYDIPALTGVNLSAHDFLAQAQGRIPTLAGIKFSNNDLMMYQKCNRLFDAFDLPWGIDEFILAALALGAKGGVGSSYNFAAPIFWKVFQAYETGDWEHARDWQFRGLQVIDTLAKYGYMAAAKQVMTWLGVPVGAPRLPHQKLSLSQSEQLQLDLERLGFFNWIKV